jgi:signal transduction histidine kinase
MMLSTLARKPAEQGNDANRELDQIHNTSRDLTRAMDEIVWAVDPSHDTLESLVDYLGRTAQEYLRSAGIRCRLDVPLEIPAILLTSKIRHGLFLALKEGLNNVIKHASATEARFGLELTDTELAFILEDNGKGFPMDAHSPSLSEGRLISGRGMKNLSARLQEVGGRLEITSEPGRGTRLALRIPRVPTPAKP